MKDRSRTFGHTFIARRLIPFLALPLAFLLWPSVASAESGLTFLLWFMFSPFFLFYTWVLGALEGILIGLVFRVRKIVALGVMIVANYVSIILGWQLVGALRDLVFGHFMKRAPLYDMPRLEWILLGIIFVITSMVEWPFCLLLLWRERGRWWKSVLADGLAQAFSYALLIAVFLHMGTVRLYRDVGVDPSFVASVSDEAFVYFLSPEDGDVYRVRLNGQDREKVLRLGTKARNAILLLRQSEDGKHVDLWTALGGGGIGPVNLLLEHVGVLPFPDAYDGEQTEMWVSDRFSGEGPVLDFRSSQDRAWKVQMGGYDGDLLSAENASTGESLRLTLDTLFLQWCGRSGSVIPGNKVLFELVGEPPNVPDEIVLLDLKSRKLGLITYGRSPVVVFPEQSAPAGGAPKPE